MYSKEDLKEEFAKAKAKDQSGKREVYTARAAMMKKHMEEERDMPELYENLISRQTGLPAFNFAGLYETYSSDNPKEHFWLKNYGMTYREVWMKKDPSAFKGSTEDMIDDVLVDVPEVPEDDVSRTIGEMNED